MELPEYVMVRQNFPERRLAAIPAAVARELRDSGLGAGLRPGARVAIGVGSRGIANLSTIVKAVVSWWKSEGMHPFIFPAMGSHGAATPEGQKQVLANYGVHEEAVGCPVISVMDVVSLGRTAEGIETVMDKNAWESDGVMLISRLKWHTSFEAPIESGVFKMMAIGLGRFDGAKRYHSHAYHLGLYEVIRSVGRQVLGSGKILGGLAILEDAWHNTAEVHVLRAAEMEKREEELLARVKSWRPRLPVDEVDILIVDEMGKEISGTGIDTKIVNRHSLGLANIWPGVPKVHRLFVRDLTEQTHGNAVGVGMADLVTDRLLARIDWKPTYVNVLTSGSLQAARTPMHFPTDRECLEHLAPSVGKLNPREVTLAWIRNTLELGEIAISENLVSLARRNPVVEILGEPRAFEFDGDGNLPSIFATAPATAR